jgi:hypothetical protein
MKPKTKKIISHHKNIKLLWWAVKNTFSFFSFFVLEIELRASHWAGSLPLEKLHQPFYVDFFLSFIFEIGPCCMSGPAWTVILLYPHVAGMTSAHHQTQALIEMRSQEFFFPGCPRTLIIPIWASLVVRCEPLHLAKSTQNKQQEKCKIFRKTEDIKKDQRKNLELLTQ